MAYGCFFRGEHTLELELFFFIQTGWFEKYSESNLAFHSVLLSESGFSKMNNTDTNSAAFYQHPHSLRVPLET